jgi:hypothetical protein
MSLLRRVPALVVEDVQHERDGGPDRGADLLAHVSVGGRRHTLVCQVKSEGQPRHVRLGLLQLRNYTAHFDRAAVPIFVAPYLSPDAQALCNDNGVGFLDLVGNASIIFDSVFIERQVESKPNTERRELKSLFKPKSAQVLRVLLRDPQRSWRVAELAEASAVSLGHISNVRSALIDREWARTSADGVMLTEPDALLDAWREAYEAPPGRRLRYYSALHGSAFENAVRGALSARPEGGRAMLGSFSAAQWLSPYGRSSTQFLYADDDGLVKLEESLKLSSASKGENVVVTIPKDGGIFRDAVEPAPGIICTSSVQTYLDLASAGERGREAAEHLRREQLAWRP